MVTSNRLSLTLRPSTWYASESDTEIHCPGQWLIVLCRPAQSVRHVDPSHWHRHPAPRRSGPLRVGLFRRATHRLSDRARRHWAWRAARLQCCGRGTVMPKLSLIGLWIHVTATSQWQACGRARASERPGLPGRRRQLRSPSLSGRSGRVPVRLRTSLNNTAFNHCQ